jgi:hypothetical protein
MIHIILNYTVFLQVERICVQNCLKLVSLVLSVVCSEFVPYAASLCAVCCLSLCRMLPLFSQILSGK